MSGHAPGVERIPGYCALCISRCGSIAVVQDSRFIALEPDPSHPTGKALCAKGRAAPEIVYHPERLQYPMKRTRPKGAADPGWERISWEEALSVTAAQMRQIAAENGPESVAFSLASPSTSAIDDAADWIQRLASAYGSPNLCVSMELCGWGRHLANQYTFGAPVPGAYLPDLENAGCILYWGYNPNLARLSHATATVAAAKRGAKLIVVDPRRTGIAKRADLWLQVRPGTDAALALGIAYVMIDRGWFDREFVREWTNGPLLVREDNGRLLREGDLFPGGRADRFVAWKEGGNRPLIYNPAEGRYSDRPAVTGSYRIDTVQGSTTCRPAFQRLVDHLQTYTPERVAAICGLPAGRIEAAAELLWAARPLAYYAWSGVEMQTNATQIARAVAQLSVLTGSFDVPGGNVLFPAVPAAPVTGQELLPASQRTRALGYAERPLGPSRWGFVTTEEIYQGILDGEPYPVRGLVGFGANLLLSHADSRRGREALQALEFYVHADLFMNPTAELADIVLPVTSPFESEALRFGFDISVEARSLVQLRRPVVSPRGEARSDTAIVFDLAARLGLGEHFWDGDVEAAYRHRLEPAGIAFDTLREHPEGVRVHLEPHYRRYAEKSNGAVRGVNTPTKKIELYSEIFGDHGYPPLPTYEPPLVGPEIRPDLRERFPLILTCAKHNLFCESQHRGISSLRRLAPEPEVELHPQAAGDRGIAPGDWVRIVTPDGSVRARARLNDTLQPDVVCGQHGWWQAAPEIGAPGYDPFSEDGANFNLIIGNEAIDPISGSVPHRAYLCQILLDG